MPNLIAVSYTHLDVYKRQDEKYGSRFKNTINGIDDIH